MADNVYESAKNFRELEQYEYRFVVSKNRKLYLFFIRKTIYTFPNKSRLCYRKQIT